MKAQSFLIVFLFSAVTLIAQDSSSGMFTSFDTVILGGVNITNQSESGLSFILEEKTNLTDAINLKLSFGFFQSYDKNIYPIKRYSVSDKYYTYSINVLKRTYNVFPISIGFEYNFNYSDFHTYTFIEIGYNSYTTTYLESIAERWFYLYFI
jgi:hypothetical protein